jgi:hypothetical protein
LYRFSSLGSRRLDLEYEIFCFSLGSIMQWPRMANVLLRREEQQIMRVSWIGDGDGPRDVVYLLAGRSEECFGKEEEVGVGDGDKLISRDVVHISISVVGSVIFCVQKSI